MTVKIGLVGTGTVGGGCLEILANHKQDILRHYGCEIEVVAVCSRRPDVAEKYGYGSVFTTDFHDVINNPEVQIVVELIGGTTIAREVVEGALKNNKQVVTANKALLASYGSSILKYANTHGIEMRFEAAVGGGIPIISPLKHALTANKITNIMGIVNGTTNYMLTRMDEGNLSYDEALKEAQDLGYAEADPTADVDGLDAAAKIAILASIAFNISVTIDDVYAEGIRRISPVDIQAARDMGYEVKLIAHARHTDEGVSLRVHPTMIASSHQLAKVDGVYNAIYVTGDAVGEAMFFGEGAGAGPAASSVMGDVIEISRHLALGIKPLPNNTSKDDVHLVKMEELETKYYLRFLVEDRPGVVAETTAVFAKHNISIQSMIQRGTKAKNAVDLVFVTHMARESAVRNAIKDILELENAVIGGFPSVVRVED